MEYEELPGAVFSCEEAIAAGSFIEVSLSRGVIGQVVFAADGGCVQWRTGLEAQDAACDERGVPLGGMYERGFHMQFPAFCR